MNYREVITALRASKSKSYRGLFSTAADMIEQLVADLKKTERCELCNLCVHGQHKPPCTGNYAFTEDPTTDCDTCKLDCSCVNCRNYELFEWRGVQDLLSKGE